MNPLDKIIGIVRTLKEEGGPTMAMGNGQIAGSSEAGDNPPVRKKKRYIFQRNTRKNWTPKKGQ
tara:strand:- start:889 stop:1080 length:192 start_codon:yes stop_codon:yes gene_type:complete